MPADKSLLGSGNVAEVYLHEGRALKLYRPGMTSERAFREAANLAALQGCGLPVPQVFEVSCREGRWGVLMTAVPGHSLGETMRNEAGHIDDHLGAMARLHARLHGLRAPNLPGQKLRLAAAIERAPLDDAALRQRLLDRLIELPDGQNLCHGDFHPYNLLGPADDLMIIDWLDASSGSPAADLCRSYVLMKAIDAGLAARYVEIYCGVTGQQREAVFCWLAVTAAARLAENAPRQQDALWEMIETGLGQSGPR